MNCLHCTYSKLCAVRITIAAMKEHCLMTRTTSRHLNKLRVELEVLMITTLQEVPEGDLEECLASFTAAYGDTRPIRSRILYDSSSCERYALISPPPTPRWNRASAGLWWPLSKRWRRANGWILFEIRLWPFAQPVATDLSSPMIVAAEWTGRLVFSWNSQPAGPLTFILS